MRMVMPECRDVTVAEVYDAYERPRRGNRPWILLSMITSGDGAIAIDGSSGPLGSTGDQAVFLHMHRSADVVLVGAETVRRDVYSPLPAHQWLYVVSASGDLGPRGDGVASAPNTRIVAGDVRDIVTQLPGDLCILEGGPVLNGQMLAADLVDEICLTIAPRFVSGRSRRVAEGPWAARDPWHLTHVLEEDGFLFLRYTR